MEIRFQNSPKETAGMNTSQLRENFLVQDLMVPGKMKLVYSHFDRMIIGGVVPAGSVITLENEAELKAEYFLERKEIGIINVGGNGTVTADGQDYSLEKLECAYLGKGTKAVSFSSADANTPAMLSLIHI